MGVYPADAAQVLADQMKSDNGFVAVSAATRLLDRAFQAQDSIAAEQELERLRGMIETYKALKTPALVPEVSRMPDHEEAEAAVLRVSWMGEIGNTPEDIADSLRYNRPTSVANEQELLDIVLQILATAKADQAALAV
jgi:hypothetical protein